ncbi:MAG: protein BatD, partial [Flavobacteriales bacterium]|nr:protein BatD [Flavobacteriales bacterium]
SMEVSHSYFLVPEKLGKFTIQSASAQTETGTLKSSSLDIEVVKNDAAAQNNSSPATSNRVQGGGGSTGDCMVRMFANKTEVVVGEPLVVTYMLYNRYPRFDLEQHEQLPQHSGFWKDDKLVESPQWAQEFERIDGKDYRKAHLATQVLIPQRAGELKLDRYKAQVAVGNRMSFFMNRMELKSNQVTIKVSRPPSAGKKNSYSGAVGDFDLRIKANPTTLPVNEAITLEVKISGKGNLALINALDLDLPDEFEVYDPKIKDRISTAGGGMSGSRTFEYLVIPRYPGEYRLPPIEFQFYDHKQKKYRSSFSEEINIAVEGDESMIQNGGPQVIRKEGISELASDIRHIRDEIEIDRVEGEFFPGSWKHWTGVLSPFLLLGLFMVYKGRQEDLESDAVGMRRRKAGKVATAQLKQAKSHMQSGDNEAFYSSLYQAMNDYVSQKFALPLSEVDKQSVTRAMTDAGLDAATIESWNKVLMDCEMAAYAPSAIRSPEELYQEVSDLIHTIERAL